MDKKKVILIEDDQLVRELYVENIREAGLTIEAYPNGKSGIEALRKNHYDLLLLDIMLPDINGIEILKWVRLNDSTKDLNVVILTNLVHDAVENQAMMLGAKAYLVKLSFTPDQVVEKVKEYLGLGSPPDVRTQPV